MVTIKEVMQHVKEEKGVGSDRYEKLYDYFTKFSPKELEYLEIECKRIIDEYRMPRSWNAITSMLSMLYLFVTLIVGKSSIIDLNLIFNFAIGAIILVVTFGIMDLRQIRCFDKSNKLIVVLEIINIIQKKSNEKTKSN